MFDALVHRQNGQDNRCRPGGHGRRAAADCPAPGCCGRTRRKAGPRNPVREVQAFLRNFRVLEVQERLGFVAEQLYHGVHSVFQRFKFKFQVSLRSPSWRIRPAFGNGGPGSNDRPAGILPVRSLTDATTIQPCGIDIGIASDERLMARGLETGGFIKCLSALSPDEHVQSAQLAAQAGPANSERAACPTILREA